MARHRPLLVPTNDIVFKLMLSAPECEPALTALLTAILRPPRPFKSARVINPDLPRRAVDDKGTILDILAEMDDGSRMNIEMQARNTGVMQPRALYYWARTHAGQLRRGQDYGEVRPTVAIFLLNFVEFKDIPGTFQHTFRIRHQDHPEIYLPQLRIDFIELPRLPSVLAGEGELPVDERLTLWGRFLRNPNDPEIAEVFMGDNAFKKAKERLIQISDDPHSRELARLREKAEIDYMLAITAAKKAGREEGRVEGRVEGEAEGRAKGEAEGKVEVARRLLAEPATTGLSDLQIARLTGLTVKEINELRQESRRPS